MAFSSLDIPSVMMVSIVFIIFVASSGINRLSILRIRKGADQSKEISTIMQHTLDISNNYVVCLDLIRRYGHNLHGNMLAEEGMSYEDISKITETTLGTVKSRISRARIKLQNALKEFI